MVVSWYCPEQTNTYTNTNTYTHMRARTRTHTHTHTHTHARTRTRTHTHTHTLTQFLNLYILYAVLASEDMNVALQPILDIHHGRLMIFTIKCHVRAHVFGCTNRYRKGSNVKFYRFPTCPDRRRRWIAALNRKNWTPNEFSWLCSEHFVSGKYEIMFVCNIHMKLCINVGEKSMTAHTQITYQVYFYLQSSPPWIREVS